MYGWMGFNTALDHVTALFVYGSRLPLLCWDAAEEHVISLTIIVACPQLSCSLIPGSATK